MGLRCLLGHDFGEPELRREREEDGNEVVTTVTEVKTCARCGETQVVSENTEVTTMKQLTDEATVVGDEPTGPDADSDRETPVTGVEGTGPDGDIDGDDAVIIGNSPEDGDDTADIPQSRERPTPGHRRRNRAIRPRRSRKQKRTWRRERPAMTAGQS